MQCFGCGKDDLPLFRERNRGRIFCGESCQMIGASWWLDFKRLNKVTIGKTEHELDPGMVWSLILRSGMTSDQIINDFLNYDDYTDVFASPPKTYRTNVQKHNAALKKMLTWLDNNPNFIAKGATDFFARLAYSILTSQDSTNTTEIFEHIFYSKHFSVRYFSFELMVIGTPILDLAVTREHLEIVKILLKDRRIDPTAHENFAIGSSVKEGRIKVLNLLLQDPRIDPSAPENRPIQLACEGGHLEVVQRLLQDKRVDPSANNNNAIKVACTNGHIEIVRILMNDPRVDPSGTNKRNEPLHNAVRAGHIDIVKLLLQNERVDPAAFKNRAIQLAYKNGHPEITMLLLQDDRVLYKLTPDFFDVLRKRFPAFAADVDAAQVSYALLKAVGGVRQGEGPTKRLKEKINLFSL